MRKIPGTIGATLAIVVSMAASAAPASADDCTWYPNRPDQVCKPSPDWGREAPGILKDVTADNTGGPAEACIYSSARPEAQATLRNRCSIAREGEAMGSIASHAKQ